MALSLARRAFWYVVIPPAVYMGICACGTIGKVASRYIHSEFLRDPVVKEEISKLYDAAQTKKNSSGSFFDLINKEERAALVHGEKNYEVRTTVETLANQMEADVAWNLWKQNCWRSMITDFQRRLKFNS